MSSFKKKYPIVKFCYNTTLFLLNSTELTHDEKINMAEKLTAEILLSEKGLNSNFLDGFDLHEKRKDIEYYLFTSIKLKIKKALHNTVL